MKKLLAICMIAILSLGLMGFGFAMWKDDVTITATVNTGNVKIGILDAGVNDPGADPNVSPGVNSEGKDVGRIVSENNGTAIGAIGNDYYYESITETITNAYPYYAPGSTIKIASLGSVPVKIRSITGEWDGALSDNVKVYSWTATTPEGNGTGSDWASLVQFLLGKQLHQNQVITINIQWYFDQQSEMNSSASVTYTVEAAQWNEVPSPTPPSVG